RAVLVHHRRVRRAYGKRGIRLLAYGFCLSDVVGIGIGEVLHVQAFHAVDRDTSRIGADHDEVRGPGVRVVGDAAGRVDGHGARSFMAYWWAPVSMAAAGLKKALSRPWAASNRSQHSRTAPEPPGWFDTQCATCET